MKQLISEADFAALENAVQEEALAGSYLNDVLKVAQKVPEEFIPPRTVRLNSVVHIWHALLRKVVKIRIVLPGLADLKIRNISVFAPISLALLGRRENDDVTINIGPVKKRLKIVKVTNR